MYGFSGSKNCPLDYNNTQFETKKSKIFKNKANMSHKGYKNFRQYLQFLLKIS
jgi:hypothetical protein